MVPERGELEHKTGSGGSGHMVKGRLLKTVCYGCDIWAFF